MRLWTATIAALLLLLTGSAAAQNLVVSPDFDAASEVLDWPDPFPDANTTISWQSDVDRDSS
ncbi:MAG: hypothetical protein ACR2PQ_01970, partial [Myxococcota bacterium]